MSKTSVLCSPLLMCLACASPPPADAPPPPAVDAPAASSRAELSAAECEGQNASVVGDIGDGAIHRPDYRCPSGASPIGSIAAAPDGPMGVEGSVCCPN